MTDLADRLDIDTPMMDALITMASVVLARDFRAEANRTLSSLGLDGMTAGELATAIAQLCAHLTATQTRYPGTNLILRYQIKTAQ